MRHLPPWLRALTVSGGCLLAGCGGSTTTVSVSSAPPTRSAPTAPAKTTAPSSRPTAKAPARSAPAASTPARTAPAPSFTEQRNPGAQQGSSAAAIVRAHGYSPNNTSDYHSNQTLAVLIGTRTGSGQQAFFFVNGKYIGTDSTEPSASLKVVSQGDTAVTLAYPLYRSKDALCCPSGGETNVTFELNNGKLEPLQPIPPASSSSGFSRQ